MKEQRLMINGKEVIFNERDYIFAIFFRYYYDLFQDQLKMYSNVLRMLGDLSLGEIKNLKFIRKNYLLITKTQDIELYDKLFESDSYITGVINKRIGSLYENVSVMEGIFEDILDTDMEVYFEENHNFGITSCDISENIRRWKYQAFKEGIVHTDYDEYCKHYFMDLIDYENMDFWEYELQQFMYKYLNLFVDIVLNEYPGKPEISDEQKVVDRADLLIKLQAEDFKENFLEQMNVDIIYLILFLIGCWIQKCNIPIKIQYCRWDNFNTYYKTYHLQCERSCNDKNEIMENFLRFPFISLQYNLVLRSIGDTELELQKIAAIFRVDILELKRKENERYVSIKKGIDMSDETTVKETYNEVFQYRKFLGYHCTSEYEDELKIKLDEFDTIHRTVNGKLYDTLEQADEIRARSFDGKEYRTKAQAELVKSEIESIRSVYEDKDLLDKYKIYECLNEQTWKTEEAKEELDRLKQRMEIEYRELKENADSIPSKKKKLKWKCIISGIILLTLVVFDCNLIFFIVILLLMILILNENRKDLNRAKKAQKDYWEITQRYIQDQKVCVNGENIFSKNPYHKNICPKCRCMITDDMKFCPYCGNKL